MTIATPTAPPTKPAISQPTHLVPTAPPDCNPGFAVLVPVAVPTVPLGGETSDVGACTTVTAVMVDWLPLGRVVVCSTVLVPELAWEGEMVTTPPPMVLARVTPLALVVVSRDPIVTTPPPIVLTTVTPAALVVVTIAPEVRETLDPPCEDEA